MKILKMRNYEQKGSGALHWFFCAEVLIEEGWWPFKKTEWRSVQRKYGGRWFFTDSGDWCSHLVDRLERAKEAKERNSS